MLPISSDCEKPERWGRFLISCEIQSNITSGRNIRNAFVDGNKRIGTYIMLTFLEMNGIRIHCTDEELVHIGLSVADGSMKYEELLQWVRDHE